MIEEASRPGRLRNELVEPIVKRNIQALKESGLKVPMKAIAVIKNLPVGSAFTFPDGTIVTQEEAVEPPRKGRKVVICGDTSNSRALEGKTLTCHRVRSLCCLAILLYVSHFKMVRVAAAM
jgi:ribonuclease Z